MYSSIYEGNSTHRVSKVSLYHNLCTEIILDSCFFFSEELQREITKKDDEKCVTVFANLTEISRNLEDFSGVHLGQFLKETIHHWHNVLKDKLGR